MNETKVLFIVPYPKDCAPSQRLKFEQYFDYFEKNNVKICFSPFMTKKFWNIVYKKGFFWQKVIYTFFGYLRRIKDVFRAYQQDIIYIHLEAAPFGPPLFEKIFSLIGKKIIYDIDDLIFLPNKESPHSFVDFLRNRRKVFKIMELSNCVIVVTKYLAELSTEYNKNVIFIPPTINTEIYIPPKKHNTKNICIGWSGSFSTTKYLKLLKNVLTSIKKNYPKIKIKVIGDKNFKIEGINIDAKDWLNEDEVKDIGELNIGLYPLTKEEWVLGKGGLKCLQYMGMGIPAICTKYGAASEIINQGVDGFLVDSEEDWIDAISTLIKNPKLREKIGKAARKKVEEKYSVNAYKEVMLNIIKSNQI